MILLHQIWSLSIFSNPFPVLSCWNYYFFPFSIEFVYSQLIYHDCLTGLPTQIRDAVLDESDVMNVPENDVNREYLFRQLERQTEIGDKDASGMLALPYGIITAATMMTMAMTICMYRKVEPCWDGRSFSEEVGSIVILIEQGLMLCMFVDISPTSVYKTFASYFWRGNVRRVVVVLTVTKRL